MKYQLALRRAQYLEWVLRRAYRESDDWRIQSLIRRAIPDLPAVEDPTRFEEMDDG